MSLRRGAAALAVLIAAIAVYLPGLPGEFVYDDHRLIVDNDGLKRPFEPGRAFLRDYYASDLDRTSLGYYRPVAILANEFDYRRGAGSAAPFHATNVAIHAACALLVFALGLRLLGRDAPAALAALLFAVHPAHAESVAFISGRVDPLAATFGLAAIVAHLLANRGKRVALWRALAGGAWLLALLSKEMAVTLPIAVALLETAEEGLPRGAGVWRARAARYLPFVAAFAIYLPLRIAALGGLVNPPTGEATLSLARPFVVLGSYAAWLLLPPPGLNLEPAAAAGPAAALVVVALFAAVVFAAALAFAARPLPAALIAAALLALLPVAQLRPIETELSERFLYMPSAFAMLALATFAPRGAARRTRAVAAAAVLALAGLYASILVPRAVIWRDEISLWQRKELEDPGSLKARINLGRSFARRGDAAEARLWYDRAIAVAPDLADSLRGEMDALSGRLDEPSLRRALAALPADGALWNNLGFVLLDQGDVAGAAEAFRKCNALTPLRATGWLGTALAALRAGDLGTAAEAAERAGTLDPGLGLARAVLAESLLRQGKACEALAAAAGVRLDTPEQQAMLDRLASAARGACTSPLPN